jgi:hypothetical protein
MKHDWLFMLACHSGGPQGMLQKACKEISAHGLDDTFYLVDLANVLRMYKVKLGVDWMIGGG